MIFGVRRTSDKSNPAACHSSPLCFVPSADVEKMSTSRNVKTNAGRYKCGVYLNYDESKTF